MMVTQEDQKERRKHPKNLKFYHNFCCMFAENAIRIMSGILVQI